MELRPPQCLGVVAIEKGAIRSPSTKVANFTFTYLWHINHCRLFNAKYFLYIYIKYIGFSLVGFYGISTIVGCLMPNPLYIYKI